MKKIVSVCALLIAACPLSSWAEWTGDSSINYYSDEVISDFHVGQYHSSAYFCIKTVKKSGEGTPVIACAFEKESKWHPSFNTMLGQARHFYIIGQTIRVYVEPNTWTDQSFVNAFSSNALVGLSSCSTDSTDSTGSTECFGPK
ncbi:subtilase cytotoxin subunit B [Salmonella enterica subsp. diarizonae]|uniref:subtilase family AB5 toxin binding subunit n=1 Tax=Salmonella enterica TaxID=28901 RepID=UPI0003BCD7DD|nr:subtilase family AB5 toxin binding subunit [Salmonella enterica]EAW1823904.1 subtilase cytotoxin subunit B [Salmonella enterica subsp. diarizonae]EDT6985325.1 subtilase cytotoxin subunit B [Salmonella enterica subsp. arizonae]ESJ19532.1 subtilase cytotoxin subunit B [Salmonella enterica subsp. diarizonae serovar 60:r:e,n,x,z15 str. 01-0170]EAM9431741.1 subtilase cytotoxin subunit B [Salmonella enterica]EAO7619096.1 subtilase cytotoxin subunit B [Salmonella enterica]